MSIERAVGAKEDISGSSPSKGKRQVARHLYGAGQHSPPPEHRPRCRGRGRWLTPLLRRLRIPAGKVTLVAPACCTSVHGLSVHVEKGEWEKENAPVLAQVRVLLPTSVSPGVEVRVAGGLRQLVSEDGDEAVHPQVAVGGLDSAGDHRPRNTVHGALLGVR